MAITAKLLDAVKRDAGWKIKVEFTDGAEVREQTFRFNGVTVQDLIDFVRARAVQREAAATSDYSIYIGQSIDVTPIDNTPADPTQAELDEAAWLKDWYNLKVAQKVLTELPALATAGRIAYRDGLVATLEAGWLDSYLGSI